MTEKLPTLQECEAAYDDAVRREKEVENNIKKEAREAAREVEERRASELSAVRQARTAVQRDLLAAKDRLPDHEWTGKRVYKMMSRGGFRREPVRVDGIVETVRSTTVWPDNISRYRMIAIGKPLVRLLKADGKPGVKFEEMNGEHHGWKLVEGGS